MPLNDDLDRRPMPLAIRQNLPAARVVTLSPGTALFRMAGSAWTPSGVDAVWVDASAFRQLKALGDLNERLHNTPPGLRHALGADHFEGREQTEIEVHVIERIKAYSCNSAELGGDVLCIPGVGDGTRPTPLSLRAMRVVRRVVIK